jgi:hypothetical protein
MPCYAVQFSMRCYAMRCYAMLCYAMLCYAMLCYALIIWTSSLPVQFLGNFQLLCHVCNVWANIDKMIKIDKTPAIAFAGHPDISFRRCKL